MFALKLLHARVNFKDVFPQRAVIILSYGIGIEQFSLTISASFQSSFSPCLIDKNLFHRSRSGPEQVAFAVPAWIRLTDELDKDLVDKCCCLQCLPWRK